MLLTIDGVIFCSWCGSRVDGNTWKSVKVRGYFCGKSCRDTAQGDEDYLNEHPKGGN